MKKIISLLLIAFLVSGLLVGCSNRNETSIDTDANVDEGKPIEIRIACVGNESHQYTIAANIFKEEIEKLSEGKVNVTVFPNASLGGERKAAESVKMGTIEMSVLCPDGVLPLWIPDTQALSIPYLFKDREDAYAKLDGIVTELLDPKYEEQGFKNLGYVELGFRHFTNNKREIKTAADLKGLKIRVVEAPIWFSLIETLGGIPTPIAFDELYTALQQEVVDGQENPVGTIASQKYYEVQKYLTLDGHNYSSGIIMANKKFYDSLSDEAKGWMDEAAKITVKKQRQIISDREKEYIEELKNAGMTITEPDKQSFIDATEGLFLLDEVKKLVDPKIVEKIMEN